MHIASELSANIASALPKMAEKQPDTMAVIFPCSSDETTPIDTYPQFTFRQLDQYSDELSQGFSQIGITKNVRTVLMVRPSLDFFALTFALFKVGATMVCVDPGIGIKNLGKCLAEAEPQAFIGIPQAHLARRLFGWAKNTNKINVLVGGKKWLPTRMHRLEAIRQKGQAANSNSELLTTIAEDNAAILFTSGSTGVPKGVIYTHANFQTQVDMLQKRFDIEPGEIDLCTFPLFALFAPALGMSAVIPEMDFTKPGSVDPTKIISAVKQFNVTNMFGSPALLNRVGIFAERENVKLPSLRRIISAGAPVHASIIRRFENVLNEGVEIFTPYGATESLPVAVIGSKEILSETAKKTEQGLGICVGKPVDQIDVRIIKINDEPIAEFSDKLLSHEEEIGEVIVKGPVVTRQYYNNAVQTKLAKISDPNGGFYHRMGDLGYFDNQGRLWFCGRKSHRVVTAEKTYYSVTCEGIFNTHEQVFRSALIQVSQGGSEVGQIKAGICIELLPEYKKQSRPSTLQKEVINQLKQIGAKYEQTTDIDEFYIDASFPVDIRHNSKINRPLLSRKYGGVS